MSLFPTSEKNAMVPLESGFPLTEIFPETVPVLGAQPTPSMTARSKHGARTRQERNMQVLGRFGETKEGGPKRGPPRAMRRECYGTFAVRPSAGVHRFHQRFASMLSDRLRTLPSPRQTCMTWCEVDARA